MPLLLAPCASSLSLSSTIGATHWNPCYWNVNLPNQSVLTNGVTTLAGMQTRAVKLALFDPVGNYPFLSDWSAVANYTSLLQLAQHPYYDAVFQRDDFDVFALVAYRWVPSIPTGGDYWCTGITPADEVDETEQFKSLTMYLMTAFNASGKRFILQHWEGDWAARCGSYNASQPASPAAQVNMIAWLKSRQAGVDAARSQYCAQYLPADFNCSNHAAVMAAAGVEVLHASEVNLVLSSMQSGFPNNILAVIPHVALDMLSYSSYDTQALNATFGAALDFIAEHHNRSTGAPQPGVYVGEYGVAQEVSPFSELQHVMKNVMTYALGGASPRAAHTFAWELFDNEADIPGGRCHTYPVWNTSLLHGYWLMTPNGSTTWGWGYLQGVINGSIPMPTPQEVGGDEEQL